MTSWHENAFHNTGPFWGELPVDSKGPVMGSIGVSFVDKKICRLNTWNRRMADVFWRHDALVTLHEYILQVWCDMEAQPPRAYVSHDQMTFTMVDGNEEPCSQTCTSCFRQSVIYKGVYLVSEVRQFVEASESCTYNYDAYCRGAAGEYQGIFDYGAYYDGTFQRMGEAGADCAGENALKKSRVKWTPFQRHSSNS